MPPPPDITKAPEGVHGVVEFVDCECDIALCPYVEECFGWGLPHPFSPRKPRRQPKEDDADEDASEA